MVKLTEDMVIARSKGSDLHNVRKLNCWGSELSDVAVVRKLPNVEVLSLSVNQIQTLADFQYCPNLQELYIRKNKIHDINEVLYLRQLPKLKSLWLADNPCAEFEKYRQTVLRALPHLQKLDNVAVDSEEVQQAMVSGIPLPVSDAREEREMPRSASMGESLRSEGGSSLSDCSPPSSERRYPHTTASTRVQHQEVYGQQSLDDGYEYSQDDDDEGVGRRTSYQHYQQQVAEPERRTSHYSNQDTSPQSPSRRSSQVAEADSTDPRGYIRSPESRTHTSDYEYDSRNANYLSRENSGAHRYTTNGTNPGSPHTPDNNDSNATNNNPLCPLHRRTGQEQYRDQRWNEMEERERGYSRGDGYGYAAPPPTEVRQSPVGYEQRVTQDPRHEGRKTENGVVQQHYDNTYRRVEQQIETATRSAVVVERTSPTKPYPARPKTRNANVLSAVLCLIKELDYSSLEVVEMAVRCRMDELDD